jgi:hypothetical protein
MHKTWGEEPVRAAAFAQERTVVRRYRCWNRLSSASLTRRPFIAAPADSYSGLTDKSRHFFRTIFHTYQNVEWIVKMGKALCERGSGRGEGEEGQD